MKHCPKCEKDKSLDDFGVNNTKADGRQSICKECRRTYQKQWYGDNRETQSLRVRKTDSVRKADLQLRLLEFYKSHPCVDCGEDDPVVLECDHQRDKLMNVSKMMSRKMSWDKIEQELAKCEVRCSNCHKRKTARQFGWYKMVRDRLEIVPA